MAVPPPPGTRSNSRIFGFIALGIGAVLALFICTGVVGGAGWWWNQSDQPEASTLTMEDITIADGLPVEDDEVTEPKPEVADSYQPSWWSPDYWSGTPDEPVDAATTIAATEPSASPDPATTTVTAPPVFVGFRADGTSFSAPSETGVDVSTAEVMLGNVSDSARSAAGKSEVYWVQGTHEDAFSGARVDRSGKVVNPDDIRQLVGIRTTWTAIPGNVDVNVKCIPVHATDDEVPGSCLPIQTASR